MRSMRWILAPTFAAFLVPLILISSCDDTGSPEVAMDESHSPLVPLIAEGVPPSDTVEPAAATWTQPRRVVWIHRSVGGNIIRKGDVDMYDVLDSLNAVHGTDLELWHHFSGGPPYWNRYYDGDDAQVIPNFGPALDESNQLHPQHLMRIFCSDDPQYVAARDSIDEFKLILFKSGYDNTVPYGTDRTGLWRDCYRAMKDSPLLSDPSRRVIVMGFPPLRYGLGAATQADADSCRAFNEWLVEDFVADRDNLFGFPLWDIMAGPNNWLRPQYEMIDVAIDSHPNEYGSEIIGRYLMRFIHEVARQEGDTEPGQWPRGARHFERHEETVRFIPDRRP